jgi:hypothetical protein
MEELNEDAGFYKWDEANGEWLLGRVIIGPYRRYELDWKLKDTYEYPVEGWVWYDEKPEDKI